MAKVIDRAVIVAIPNANHRSRLTYDRTHAMLPVLGKPLVVRMMNQLYRQGIEKFIVVIGHNEGGVAAYLARFWAPDVDVQFVVKAAHSSLSDILAEIARQHQRPFFLASYNSFTHTNFVERLEKMYQEQQSGVVIGSAASALTFSVSGFRGETAQGSHDLMAIVAQGSETAASSTLSLIEFAACGEDFLSFLNSKERGVTPRHRIIDLFADYLHHGGRASVAEAAWVLQIETDVDLMTLNHLLLDEGLDAHLLSELPSSVQIIPPVRIDPQVSIGPGAVIGPYVYLESGCTVGAKARIENVIVLERGLVSAGESLSHMIISSRERIPV
jgi:NDP-sugar pyrophosphorylase family protein